MSVAYAYRNTEKEIMRSSSGGAFIALCEAFEHAHGKGNVHFYGAVLTEKMNVRHECVHSAEDCRIFQGSKYVRSNMAGIMERIEEQLRSGQYVLFSGIPCQVYALNTFLKKKEISKEHLVTIDVICHGTPQTKVWNDYKEWLERKNQSKLIEYSFRYKPEGWKAYPAYARFANGKECINTGDTSVFSRLHMERFSIGKGCFSCPFSCEERQSDITLGDFWTADRFAPEIFTKKGVSLLLCNTEKAEQLLQDIHYENGAAIKKIMGKEYLKCQHNLNRPTEKPEGYESFWLFYENHSFEETLRKYIGYGLKYKLVYKIKKVIRKTPVIEWYRSIRR